MFTKEWIENNLMNRKTAISLIAVTFSKAAQEDVSRELFIKCMETLGVSKQECIDVEIETYDKIHK